MPVNRSGLISTEGTHFEATLVVSDAADTPRSLTPYSTPSPPGLASLLPSTQTQQKMSKRAHEDETYEEQEEDAGEGEHMDGDDEQHDLASQRRRTGTRSSGASAAAAAASTGGAAAAAGGGKKKASAWTAADDVSLCRAVQSFVEKHRGMLPSAPKAKATKAPGWDEIAKGVPKLGGTPVVEAGKAASNRWGKIRTELKVRQTNSRQADGGDEQIDCLLTRAFLLLL